MDDSRDITGKEELVIAERRAQAIRDLVDGFSAIPERWARILADEYGDDFKGVMWGTMFLVNNYVDRERIFDLLRTVDDEELGVVREVADIGIFAWEIDGELVLGINGAGYDFFASHWRKLYDALGYRWHESN